LQQEIHNSLDSLGNRSVHQAPQKERFEKEMQTINNPKEIETMTYTTNGLTLDEVGFIQIAGIKALSAAAKGELDLNRLAREELASRGLDKEGHWVGFDRASQIHNIKK
jgi:hypothetical protein